ncbi:MAG: VapC toxin family PIN domain ribonuclease [Opitutae bacterium]|nr:VapC toxin family PIN domain ribonuclease [Opitutae bacterium]
MSKPCLLDVNALVGLLWSVHSLHGRAHAWFAKESPVVLGCAFTELSFIRVSMADKTIAAGFADAEHALAQFTASLGRRYRFIDKLPPASMLRAQSIRTHKEVSDHYLCELAVANGARLVTLDAGIKHPAAWLIA